MAKKISAIIFLLLMLFALYIFYPKAGKESVIRVISPSEIVLSSGEIVKIDGLDYFDASYSEKNKQYSLKFNISEDKAFIIGTFTNYWVKNNLVGKKVIRKHNDLFYNKLSYVERFKNSAYFIKNKEIANKKQFEALVKKINPEKYVIIDVDTDKIYQISRFNAENLKNYVVERKPYAKRTTLHKNFSNNIRINVPKNILDLGIYKIILNDYTKKLKSDKNCSSDICKELLYQINNAQRSIDMAIYGYTYVPKIEKEIKSAQDRGVKIRLVYDLSKDGSNVYEDTPKIVSLIPNCKNDILSAEGMNLMHNKFYIFDNKIVITGSANLSQTDMSGFNSNAIIVIKSPMVAKYYSDEFNQMYEGNFHNSKSKILKDDDLKDIKIYFSPKDRPIESALIPVIKSAKNYIYIPTFILTNSKLVDELILAKRRGVDVKIIADALNASNRSSRHKMIREAGIPLKTENYAGKMHSKSMIIDDEYVIIGSMNFSNTANTKNDENLIVLKNSEAAKFYKTFFLYTWNKIPDKWLKYSARAEGFDSIGSCSDGIDNNYDEQVDGDDPACKEKK